MCGTAITAHDVKHIAEDGCGNAQPSFFIDVDEGVSASPSRTTHVLAV